jgi:phenylpyruvate tautomerase PptA (4-oxalocrotonate tautomerase family)
MPLCFLEAPEGIEPAAKATMMQRATVALEEAYPFPDDDIRIYLREYRSENVSLNGKLNAESPRIAFFVEGPPLGSATTKKKMVEEVTAAIAEGYRGLTREDQIAILVNEYPIENVGFGGRLQSENPGDAEALKNMAKPEK